MEKLMDARVLRSRQVLRSSAIALMTKKEKFSISELLVHAHITRGTFYRHYNNKADLIYDVNSHLVDQLLQHSEGTFSCYSMLLEVADKGTFYHAVFNHNKDASLVYLLVERLRKQRDTALLDMVPGPMKTRIVFQWEMMVAAYFAAVSLWLEEGMPFPPEELVEEFKLLWRNSTGRTKKSAQALFDFSCHVQQNRGEEFFIQS
ncbi:TetR/AcrR family transcriptional regulator [Fructobacillus sp. W13]|uniref:TetR/AcrR family transcriptional regulator n=1 Tax=Fructobacillus apis TaxID=2935017 RepID=A0ABT0ZNP9_9LACO|nr:TetR/AcrR family transcriptional regulator [Fructobacillus apis]MCO0831585.1 TetR/AcrR family transcriptional regulator [Fructobacillus apis]